MADRLGDNRPRLPQKRVGRGAFLKGVGVGLAGALGGPPAWRALTGETNQPKPAETKSSPIEIPGITPEQDATIEELPLKLDPDKACVLGFSGYDEIWDFSGRVKYSHRAGEYGKVFIGKGKSKEGEVVEKRILSDFPEGIERLRLSPDGASILVNTRLGISDGKFNLSQAGSMFDAFPQTSVVLERPKTKGGQQKGVRMPIGASAAYDSLGRVFAYTEGKVTDIGKIVIDLEKGEASAADPAKTLVYPGLRIYSLEKPIPVVPQGELDLGIATDIGGALNRRWARFLSQGRNSVLDGAFVVKRYKDDDFAVTTDGQWVCLPVEETLYWTEGKQPHAAASKNLLISRLMQRKVDQQEQISWDPSSLIRISPLEYPDLNGKADKTEVIGVTAEGQFLVAFYPKTEKAFDIKEAVLGMVNPQVGGGYEIRYISLPNKVVEINRKMAGVFPSFRPEINEYLNSPYLSNDQLKQLSAMPAWRRYKLENGSFVVDQAFPSYSGQQEFLKAPKPTPTPTPKLPPLGEQF